MHTDVQPLSGTSECAVSMRSRHFYLGEPLKLRTLIVSSMLIALSAVLIGPFSVRIPIYGTQALSLGLGVIPVIFAGALLGPAYGLCVGALADFTSAIVFPKGAYFPGFTLSYALMACLPALFLYGRTHISYLRALCGVMLGQTVGSMLLNSWFLVSFLGQPVAILPFRLTTQAVMIPIYALLIYRVLKHKHVFFRLLRKNERTQ